MARKKMTEEEREQRRVAAERRRADARKSVNPWLISELKHEDEDRNRFYMGRSFSLSLGNGASISSILHGGHRW